MNIDYQLQKITIFNIHNNNNTLSIVDNVRRQTTISYIQNNNNNDWPMT